MPANVVLIVLDAVRSDALEPYGAETGASPRIAEAAESGTVVDSAYATASWTVPSHVSVFTGRLPGSLDLLQVGSGRVADCRDRLLAASDRMLGAVLSDAGYSTAMITANLWLRPEGGFAEGFDYFRDIEAPRPAFEGPGRRMQLRRSLQAFRARHDDGGTAAVAEVRRLLSERDQDRPFFWFLNLIEAHSPYLPPRQFNPLGGRDRIRAWEEAGRHLKLTEIWRNSIGQLEVPDEAIERMRALYAGAVQAVDARVGEILAALEGAGVLEDTIVCITADHGENLGEAGLMAHAFSLDQRLIHVPMIFAGHPPTDLPRPLSLAALPRLISESVGVEGPWRADDLPEGVAVAQFDPPAPRGDVRVRKMIEGWGFGEEEERRMTSQLDAVTDGDWKLVVDDGERRLFDLSADPGEQHPVPPAEVPAEVAATLAQALEHPAAARAAVSPLPSDSAGEAEEEERADLEARMRVLGYL